MGKQTTTITGDQLGLFVRRGQAAQAAVDKLLEPHLTRRGTMGEFMAAHKRNAAKADADRRALEVALEAALEAGELKRLERQDDARRAAKGAEVSREAVLSLDLSEIEAAVVAELERRGPGTAEQLGARLGVSDPGLSAWGPQTMSGACNRLMRKRRIFRRHKRPALSGRLAWVWELRGPDTLVDGQG